MATTYWNSSNGLWQDDASWTNGVSGTGDIAVFQGTPLSNVSVSVGPEYDFKLEKIIVRPTYSGDIMSSGNPLTGTGATQVSMAGTGSFYLQVPNLGAAIDVDYLIVDSSNLIDALILSGSEGADTVDELIVQRGGVSITSSKPYINTLTVGWINNPASDARVDVVDDSTRLIDLVMFGGIVNNEEQITRLYMAGGILTHADGSIGSISLYGGTINYNANNDITGAIRMFNSGTIDLRNNRYEVALSKVFRYTRQSQLLYNQGLHTITFKDVHKDGYYA